MFILLFILILIFIFDFVLILCFNINILFFILFVSYFRQKPTFVGRSEGRGGYGSKPATPNPNPGL